jgi:hypothetical protein
MKGEPQVSSAAATDTRPHSVAGVSAGQSPQSSAGLAAEVVTVLARMSYGERVRAYRSGAISTHELAIAAAWFPDRVPLLNDEFEWIAIDLADLE